MMISSSVLVSFIRSSFIAASPYLKGYFTF
jgi:hypothetical protein